MLGDNAYPDGKDEEYQDALFENMYEETLRNSALFPVVGNHEIDGTTITNSIYQTGTYYDIFTLPRAGEAGDAGQAPRPTTHLTTATSTLSVSNR